MLARIQTRIDAYNAVLDALEKDAEDRAEEIAELNRALASVEEEKKRVERGQARLDDIQSQIEAESDVWETCLEDLRTLTRLDLDRCLKLYSQRRFTAGQMRRALDTLFCAPEHCRCDDLCGDFLNRTLGLKLFQS